MSKAIYRDDYSRYISNLERRISDVERSLYSELVSETYVEAGRSALQTISNNVNTPVVFDLHFSEFGETIHDIVTNNTRFYAPKSGLYLFQSNIRWDNNSTGERAIIINKNGAGTITSDNIIIEDVRDASGYSNQAISCATYLNIGEYVELFVYQNSGSSRQLIITYPNIPRLSAILVS